MTATPIIRVALAFLLLAPIAATAQQVGERQPTARLHGRVLGEGDRAPLTGALVELLDEADNMRVRGLTGPDGRFALRAAAGSYRVSVGMLGYASITTGWVELPPGETVTLEIVVPLEPIRLEGIRASTDRRCGRPRGSELVRVWGEARKVLAAVDVTEEARTVRFQLAITDRDLHPEWGRVLHEETRVSRAWGAQSFRSAPVDELMAHGFIRSRADTALYLAPDADVLLSDAFLDRYCFSVVDGADDEIGLAFEPETRDRDRSQIEGVLWLDRAGRGLRRLEYDYLDPPVRGEARGEVHYQRLPNGAWIVSEWAIHMPRPSIIDGVLTAEPGGTHVTSGRVVSVRSADFRVRPGQETTTVDGRVVDADSGHPLGNVLVYLEGTPHADTTAADGTFAFDDVRSGRYRIRWHHPGLRRGAAPPRTIDVPGDAPVVIRARLRPAIRAGCAAGEGSAIRGTIQDDDASVPIPGVTVRLRKSPPAAERASAAPTSARSDSAGASTRSGSDGAGASTRSGSDGGFRFCDLAPGDWVVEAGVAGADRVATTVALTADTAVHLELAVPLPRLATGTAAAGRSGDRAGPGGSEGRVIGTVLDGVEGRPVVGAMVTLGGRADSVAVLTDYRGRFLARGLDSRVVPLRITHVGFDPVEDTLFVRPGGLVHVEVRVDPISLDPITVTARRRGLLTDVYWRANQGLGGLFLTEPEIRARTPSRVTDALRAQPGVHLTTAGRGRAGQLELRGGCAPQVYIDGIRVTRVPARRSAAALGEAFQAVNMVHPWSIEIMEVYRGASEVPGQFGGSTGGCGAIAIWTHRGGAAQRPPPRRLLPPDQSARKAVVPVRDASSLPGKDVTTRVEEADRPRRQLLHIDNHARATLHVTSITLRNCTNVRERCGRHEIDVLVPPGESRTLFEVHRARPTDAVRFNWSYQAARSGG